MSIKVKYDSMLMTLLNSIFYPSPDEADEFLPIVKDMKNIPNIISFLNSDKNIQMDLNNRISLVFFLKNLFSENNDLMPLFIKRCVQNKKTLLESIVDLYLNDKVYGESQALLEDFINNVNFTVSVSRNIFEYIYQKISVYYNVYQKIKYEKTNLTGKLLLKYLKLLNIFYTDVKNENKEQEEKDSDVKKTEEKKNNEDKIIRNYFYFNGLNSRITLSLNKSSTNLNIDSPSLVDGLSLIFYVNLEKELLDNYFKTVLPTANTKVYLIKLLIGEHVLCVELKNSETISIIVDQEESNEISISNDFKYYSWNCFMLLIESKSSKKKGGIKIEINESIYESSITLPKYFYSNERIDNIILFDNLLGKVTSIILFSYQIDGKLLKFFNTTLYGGFYKNKYLFRFLHSINKKYGQTIKNYREYDKFKTDKPTDKLYNLSIDLKDINKNKIISILCPFLYNQNMKVIDDVFGILTGKICSEYDGVNLFSNNIKNVTKLGGIDNLLPIVELMLLSSKSNNYSIENNLLTEGSLLELLKIIKQILNHHKESIFDINNNYFFSSLALFFEKFPSWIFTINVLNLLLEICRETFRYRTNDPQSISENFSINYNFMSIIIFNEKIISKFTFENQFKIWEGIYNYFKKDPKPIKDSIDFQKIINLLRFYDRNRYDKYCCKKHASLLRSNDENEIVQPDMNSRLGKLLDIIQLYIDKVDPGKDKINLYTILALDLSPCLKKKIIQIYIYHFINDKITDETKEKTLNNLLKNNYFEITEYVLTVSLLDVRAEIFKLLHIILLKYKDKAMEHLTKCSLNHNQIFSFISLNVLPVETRATQATERKTSSTEAETETETESQEGIIEYKDNILGIIQDKNLLSYYFDRNAYNNDINYLWGLFNSWFTENAPKDLTPSPSSNILRKTHNISKNKEAQDFEESIIKDNQYNLLINPFILSFSIDFVSNVNTVFIDSFLSCILSSLTESMTINKEVLIKDRKFFQWLVETIYFFHNKGNEQIIAEKELIPSIQKNSLQVICQVFKIKTSLKAIENKIYYLIEYSFYFKRRFTAYPALLYETIRITRLIFEELLKNTDLYFNIITIFCFEFMFLHKNSEKLLSNFDCQFRRNSLLDSDVLNKTIKKSLEEEKDANKKKSARASVEFEDYIGRLTSIVRGSIMSRIKPPEESVEANPNIDIELIPKYYHEGIYSIEQPAYDQNNIGTQPKRILKNIWSDYELYSCIINYYRKNIWGAEILCKTAKMIYSKDDNILESCQNLLKNYTEEKELKNILFKKIKFLLVIDDDYQNGINKINLLYLNLILICFSLDIAVVLSEQEEITQLLLEFLIFCIMVSINISQNENLYNYIQKKLYDTISYGLIFLKDRDQVKYRELMFYLIQPFFDGITSQGNLNKLFASKKSLYRNTAIYRVFIKTDVDNSEPKSTKLDESPKKKGASSSIPKKKFSILTRKASTKKKDGEKKKANKVLLFLRGSPAKITEVIYEKIIDFFKEEKYLFNMDDDLILFYFKKEKKEKKMFENIIEAEKKRINIFFKKFIPNIFGEISKSSINSYLEEKKRKNRLKKIKKSLFTWNGFWSDKNLFFNHPEYLKYKIKNHYCKDMSKILLSPILDLNYYLPKFSKFDISKLFNKDNVNYNIIMDVDLILERDSLRKYSEQNYFDINNFTFNYLAILYKYQYSNSIWDSYYLNFVEQYNENIENKTFSSKEIFELLFQNKLNSINEDNVQSENIYTCCIVKPTHHIKGYVTTESAGIAFTYCPDNETKELLEKDPSYDKDMGACFGSTFKRHYKDKDIVCYEISYKSIEFMFIRNYFYQETGIEIYTYQKKSYFLNFKSNQELMKFINDIIQHEKFRTVKCNGYKGKKLLGYCKLFNVYSKKKSIYPGYIIDDWQNNNISSFEYLMWLNILAGRSFNDLTQYPVFPWIITNYECEELNEQEHFRNLSIPVGMFDFNEKAEMRKETFIEFYNTLKNDLKESTPNFDYNEFLDKLDVYLDHYNNKKPKKDKDKDQETDMIGEGAVNKIEINQLPYFYGSHYSNPTYVSHYLTRLFPHASISIEIHGDKFDDPNRMFFSLNRTFETASTLKDDIRELIPEFYALPEMFLNNNNLNLSQDRLDSEGNKIIINKVELPPWSNNKNIDFVIKMRKNLEKNNLKLNKWVDLIFGYLQKGEKAEENNNIFMLNTYENMVNIENIKDDDEKNALMRLVEVGVTPIQILSSESKARYEISQIAAKSPYSNSKGAFLWESKDLCCFNITMLKYEKLITKLISDYKKDSDKYILPRISKIKAMSKNEIRIFTNCNYWFNLKFVKNENKYIIEESSLYELTNISSKYAPSYQMSNIQAPIVVFGNNKYIIKGGFWDGRLEINIINSETKEEKDNINFSIHVLEGPVVVMEISKNENLLICGTIYGYLVAYKIEYINNGASLQLNLIKKIYDHNGLINSISINDNLNMFATCGNDDKINLYLLPTFEAFRSIKISDNSNNNKEEEELIEANNVFLSYSPLPSVSVFINSKKIFKSYTINGQYIGEMPEDDDSNLITCSVMFNDLSFCDYVIYGTNDGMIKIRSFPEMNLVNSKVICDDNEIVCLEISLDKRYCYVWNEGGEITVIKDITVNDPAEVEHKKSKFK